MGRKGLKDEKERQLDQRRTQAKAAARRYVDEVNFVVGKDSRDTMRHLQRDLREYFTDPGRGAEPVGGRGAGRGPAGGQPDAARPRGAPGGDSHAELDRLAKLLRAADELAAAEPPTREGAGGERRELVPDRRRAGPASAEAATGLRRLAGRADASPSCAARLDEPLRVAIAGKVKAGKSTLLNALVGEALAPTDAGECTRIVTWYRNGLTYRADARAPGRDACRRPGSPATAAPSTSTSTATPVDDVERLIVEWPSLGAGRDDADRHAGHRLADRRRRRSGPAPSSPRARRCTRRPTPSST